MGFNFSLATVNHLETHGYLELKMNFQVKIGAADFMGTHVWTWWYFGKHRESAKAHETEHRQKILSSFLCFVYIQENKTFTHHHNWDLIHMITQSRNKSYYNGKKKKRSIGLRR